MKNNDTNFLYSVYGSIILVLTVLLLISCGGNRLDVDTARIQLNPITIARLEKDMFDGKMPSNTLSTNLKDKYGSFFQNFQQIITSGGMRDSSDNFNLQFFVKDKDMCEAYKNCLEQYPDVTFLENEITQAFRYFKYHFPERSIPKMVTYMSGFNFSMLRVDTTIGIGLDMYLGANNKFYERLQFPKYKTATMQKEYIVADFVRAWMETEFTADKNATTNLLYKIIEAGKQYYLVDALLPAVNDTIKIGFTEKQLNWCKKNEYNMWAYFIQKKLLYSSEPAEIIKFTGEGPFTSEFKNDSPARTGIWIGWQIIRAYMNNNPQVTLTQLVQETDVQKILLKSKYKPAK